MSRELIRYVEPLEQEELAFLLKKERKDRRHFYKAARAIMIICFIVPFIFAWFNAIEGEPNAFSPVRYFLGVGFLLGFSGLTGYISYYYYLRKIQSDIRHHTKTIERAHILRKQFMPQNNAYYFYLDSPNKLSIEVTEGDFRRLNQGDEVNIEYTTYSKMYLGYF